MLQKTGSLIVCGCFVTVFAARPVLAQAAGQNVVSEPAEAAVTVELGGPHLLAAEETIPQLPVHGAGLPFLEIADDTIRDFRSFPSRDTLTLLAIGGAIALTSSSIDRPASHQMSTMSALNTPFQPGETIGGARLQILGAAATYAVGRFSGNRTVSAVGGDLLRAQILTQGITAAVKMSVRRGRPDGTEFSFPSGHSSVSFASATVLQRHFGWKVGVPAYAVASYVAASRIQEKRHFLSDVVFGAALGIAAGRTVTIGRGDSRFAMAPMAAAGGAGLSFTWLGKQ
jgi:membrane-associated phospholipid phosphatase